MNTLDANNLNLCHYQGVDTSGLSLWRHGRHGRHWLLHKYCMSVCVYIQHGNRQQVARDIQAYNLVFLIRKHIVGQPSEVKALPNALFMLVLPELTRTHTFQTQASLEMWKWVEILCMISYPPCRFWETRESIKIWPDTEYKFCCRAAGLWNAQMVTISRTWWHRILVWGRFPRSFTGELHIFTHHKDVFKVEQSCRDKSLQKKLTVPCISCDQFQPIPAEPPILISELRSTLAPRERTSYSNDTLQNSSQSCSYDICKSQLGGNLYGILYPNQNWTAILPRLMMRPQSSIYITQPQTLLWLLPAQLSLEHRGAHWLGFDPNINIWG